MPETIETAFVRIRPDVAGFQQEAGARIQGALAGVQRETLASGRAASTAAGDFDHFERGLVLTEARALGLKSVLGGVSALFVGGAGIATLIHTATREFAGFVQGSAATNAILTATAGSAHVTAAGVSALATAEERKTGIDDLQVRAAENVLLSYRRVRNEVGAGNDVFTRATKDSADLAKVLGGDVATAATQLGKALADPARGVVLLRRANVAFTSDQIKTIKALADSGQILKAQTLILDQVERSVGGTAEAIGRTLPGQLAILKERAKDALGEYVKRLSASRDAQSAVATGASAVASGFHVVEEAVATVGPPLIAVAKAVKSVEGAIGAGPILAAVVGYKALGVSIGLAGRAQGLYAKLAATAAGTNAAQAGAAVAATAALRAETGALAGVTVATRGYVTASGIAVVENDRLAASSVATGLAARASAIGMGASRLALTAIGGPLGAAALGLGAAAAGFVLIRRNAVNAAGGIAAARRALKQLDDALNASRDIRIQITGFKEGVRQAEAFAQAAAASLASAQRRQTVSTAPAGSLQARALAEQVRVARSTLARATDDVAKAEGRLQTAQANQFQQQQGRPAVIDATARALLRQIDAVRQLALAENNQTQSLGAGVIIDPNRQRQGERAMQRFLDLTGKLSASGTRADKVVGGALGRIASTLDRLPTEKQIRVVVSVATRGGSIADAVRQAGLLRSNEDIAAAGADARTRSARAIGQENVALEQEFLAAEKVLRTEQKKLATRKQAAAQAISEAQAARDAVQSATDSLTNANHALASSQQALADAIKNGQDAVTNAVTSAKTNLRSIADQIAQAIGQAADQGALKIGPEGPLAKRFQALRDQILAGRGGPDTQRAAQEVAARLQAQQPGDDTAARAKRRLDDLADSFDRGKIGAGQFNAGLQRILKESGLNLAQFGKTFGSAALHDLQDQISAARQQARAIAVGPSRPGGGQAPNIVRPLQAVAQAQRDTRDAEKNVERATRDVGRAARELNQKQLNEARTHTRELRAIRVAVQAQLRVARQQDKLTKPKTKPTGKAGQDANAVTTTGAGSP